jgi:hypothetical protein
LVLTHREDAEASQLDTVSTHKRVCDLVEHDVQDFLDLALNEKWVPSSYPLHQF